MAMAYGPDTGRPRPPRAPAWLAAPLSARTWREFCHLVVGLPLGVLYFVMSVTALAVGAGLVVTFVGVPVLATGLALCRGFGVVERARARTLLGTRVAAPEPVRTGPGSGPLAWIGATLKSGASWRHLLYAVVHLPWAVLAFSVAVTLWTTAWALLTYPLWQWLLPLHGGRSGVQLYGDGGHSVVLDTAPEVGAVSLIGLVLVLGTPWVIRALAGVDRLLVLGLLGPSRLASRVVELESGRGVVVDTAAADLRRIERDLHDGAQARLVALAMGLGLAKEKATEDPQAAARMVEEAHGEVKLALRELRDLARGIHPAVLTDRGLDAALSSVASRCTVPVTVTVDLPERPAPATEGTAYFTVCELLENVSRHAGARRATVDVWRSGDRLLVEVADDGRGGADPTAGGGLAGLSARLDAVDGILAVRSPAGGPTTVTAELPWRS
ncbi:sensor histidine kinase [Streptomyces sp. DH12]|uniref:sensor histidine kinase n=1 Tax=Streptomyces sp. DH12 TaxID=2857010 RepID=UPI001E4DC4EA|nr:sensor histidine kinase [Streptomyces sp. DH12]